MHRRTFGAALALAACFTLARPALADPPAAIPFQGTLTGASNGPLNATFTLYESAAGAVGVWTETKTIAVTGGRFTTALGDNTAFPADVRFNKPYWLGVTVGNDPEMAPRLPLASVPYALGLPNVTVDRATGHVGIGTSFPGVPLTVRGAVLAWSGDGSAGVRLDADPSGGGRLNVLNTSGTTRAKLSSVQYGGLTSGGRLDLSDAGGSRAGGYVDANGRGWLFADTLDFPNAVGQKIMLYGDDPVANYGIGIQSSLLQFHTSGSSSSIAFGYGGSAAFTERMRITGGGRVGIGTSSPTTTLDVRGNVRINSGGDMYAAGGHENLYIIRGSVGSAGNIVIGAGFTVSRTAAGKYTVTFQNDEFEQPPSVTVTPWTSQPVLAVVPQTTGTLGQPAAFKVITYLNGTATDCAFSFIATANH